MLMSKIEWDNLKDEARNAAVAVHKARADFLASAPPADDSEPESTQHAENRKALRAARDRWANAALALQEAVISGLDVSYVEGEVSTPPPVFDEPQEAVASTAESAPTS